MVNNYKCKIATIEEIKTRWNNEINKNNNNELYVKAKKEYLEEVKKNNRIIYIGIINNKIICDATVVLKKESILSEAKSSSNLIAQKRVFLCGFRTDKEYENKGYFSKLHSFILNDLTKKGYTEFSLAVNIIDQRLLSIYSKWGYTNYIKTEMRFDNNKPYVFKYFYKDIKKTLTKR